MTAAARGCGSLRIAYAGSLEALVREDLIPTFERLSGYRAIAAAGGSRALARAIRDGALATDVFLSADTEVIETELFGADVAACALWYVTFATNSMVLALGSRAQRFHDGQARPTAQHVARFLRQCREAGLCLGRSDPESDPQGYRAVLAMRLLESSASASGLTKSVLGEARDPRQVFPAAEIVPMLQRDELDLALVYQSHAIEEDLPFLCLPEEANLGSPEHAGDYEKALYRCADGAEYRGRPITYAAVLVGQPPSLTAAAAFLIFLGCDEARAALQRRGFGHTYRLESCRKR